MLPEDRDISYLWDMREAAQLVRSFVQGQVYSHFYDDRLLRSAVERQVELIGEAARRVSAAF
jgi:uncharacterized protein with HEPN domain